MLELAFMARAMTTCFSESVSIRAGGRPLGTLARTRRRARAGCRSSRRRARETVASRSAPSPGAGREESSRNRTILSQRATSVRMRSRNWRASRAEWRSPFAASEASASAQPAMPARGFEISWATPETSWPRKERRSEAMRRISISRRAVMSSNQETTCVTSRPRPTGRRRTWKRPPFVSTISSCGRPVRSTSRSTGSVAR